MTFNICSIVPIPILNESLSGDIRLFSELTHTGGIYLRNNTNFIVLIKYINKSNIILKSHQILTTKF